jgi:hypothetical protein
MNIDTLITNQFKDLMTCTLNKEESKKPNRFQTLVSNFRKIIEGIEPFTYSQKSYVSYDAALCGYKLRKYCDDATQGLVESLILHELDIRGLTYATLKEGVDAKAIKAGTYIIHGKRVHLENELLPCDEFLGHPIYKFENVVFTLEHLQKEDAPVNSVGGGNIAGASPGQEPPGRRGMMYVRRNIKKTKDLKRKL